jgi:protein tyrosine phosphatase (PTP) superfamily phosphohydrolase (DUF442 family)
MRKPKKKKQFAVIVALVVTFMIGGSGGFYIYLNSNGNFHVVEKGKLYRSGQLAAKDLDKVVSAFGIRSVLNLRGANPGSAWYDNEVTITNALGVVHYDYAISAKHIVSVRQEEEILQIIRNAPKPILIHCQGGSDRTGLVSALYRFSEGEDAKEAKQELSPRYGHFPYFSSETGAMDKSFRDYVQYALMHRNRIRAGDAILHSYWTKKTVR